MLLHATSQWIITKSASRLFEPISAAPTRQICHIYDGCRGISEVIGVVWSDYWRAIIELLFLEEQGVNNQARLLFLSSATVQCSVICEFTWYEKWDIVSNHASTMLPVAPSSYQVKFHFTFCWQHAAGSLDSTSTADWGLIECDPAA